jgi:translation initiation factor IF-3
MAAPIRRSRERTPFLRINDEIRAANVRLIAENGEQLGIRPLAEAFAYAEEHDLDLVQMDANADPPVCRALDYGKWRYEEERRRKAARKNQVHVSLKEVRLRPKIGPHDYAWKRDNALQFLRHGSKVKAVVLFRGRERERPQRGRDLLQRLAEDVKEVGHAEGTPAFEGRTMTLVLAPNAARL